MDIAAVRDALADLAATVQSTPPLTGYGWAPDSITEPAWVTGPYTIDYRESTFNRGCDVVRFVCSVYVGRTDDKVSQELLDAYLSGSGPTSLKATLEGTPGVPQTLGGLCDDLYVERVQGYRWYELGSHKYVGAELIVKVVGSG